MRAGRATHRVNHLALQHAARCRLAATDDLGAAIGTPREAGALDAWTWRSQLRYYLRPGDGHVTMSMVSATFDYSYEYQGNAPKLVHTPLTDKCYLTLTQAMHLGYGGNPYGPAGTSRLRRLSRPTSAFVMRRPP